MPRLLARHNLRERPDSLEGGLAGSAAHARSGHRACRGVHESPAHITSSDGHGLTACAEVGQVVESALSRAMAPPVFYEGFEVPITTSYAVYCAGAPGAGATPTRDRGSLQIDTSGHARANVLHLDTAGPGPHHEIRGTLVGDTLTGEWYSNHVEKAWYRYVGRVLPDGRIDQPQSDDPIRSNLKAEVLTLKRRLSSCCRPSAGKGTHVQGESRLGRADRRCNVRLQL